MSVHLIMVDVPTPAPTVEAHIDVLVILDLSYNQMD